MKSKHITGTVLIAVGLGFLLDQFDIISFGNIFSTYWPMILVLVGLSGLFDRKSSSFGNMMLIVLGVAFQINALDILEINTLSLIFPIILILLGVNLLFSRKKKHNHEDKEYVDGLDKKTDFENEIDAFAFMSGIENNYVSQEFKGGRATSIMGGIVIDLRRASLKDNIAELDLTVIMGGTEVLVPDTWRVEITGMPILGGITNKSIVNINPDAPVLKIKGVVLMGGIEIK